MFERIGRPSDDECSQFGRRTPGVGLRRTADHFDHLQPGGQNPFDQVQGTAIAWAQECPAVHQPTADDRFRYGRIVRFGAGPGGGPEGSGIGCADSAALRQVPERAEHSAVCEEQSVGRRDDDYRSFGLHWIAHCHHEDG